jgi:hypothetical protein
MKRHLMFRFFVGLIVAMAASGCSPIEEELPEAQGNTIGYPTVGAALEALRAKGGTKVSVQDGWTVVEDMEGGEITLWTFTAVGHPAHPSAVKRTFVRDGSTNLKTSIHCEADKQACDALVRAFDALNAQMIESVRGAR